MSKIHKISQNRMMTTREVLASFECDEVLDLRSFIKTISSAYAEILLSQTILSDKFNTTNISLIAERITDIAQALDYPIKSIHGKVYFFSGEYWNELTEVGFKVLARKITKLIRNNSKRDKCSIANVDQQDKLIKQLYREVVRFSQVRRDKPTLINFNNGTLKINADNSEIKSFDRADELTSKFSFDYDKSADCPLFKKVLNDSLPETAQKIIAEFVGLSIIDVFSADAPNVEKVLIMIGDGQNGKSVIMESIMNALGDQMTCNVDIVQACVAQEANLRMNLVGKRLNNSSDTNLKKLTTKGDTSELKRLISRQGSVVKSLYANKEITRDLPMHIASANELPVNVEFTDGFFRRFILIPFENKVPEHKKDRKLITKIRDGYTDENGKKHEPELAGIVNWLIEGLLRFRDQRGFTKSKEADQKMERFKIESNPVALFLEENEYIPRIDGVRKLTKDLFLEYSSWAHEGGYKPMSIGTFGKRMTKLGWSDKFKPRSKNDRFYLLGKPISNQYSLDAEVINLDQNKEKLPF